MDIDENVIGKGPNVAFMPMRQAEELRAENARLREQANAAIHTVWRLRQTVESYRKDAEQRARGNPHGLENGDTREKLEADIAASSYPFVHTPAGFRDVKSWLDRQAAITEREIAERREEYGKLPCGGADCMELVNELQAERDKLLAERDQLQEQHGRQANTIERLTAERDELKAEIAKYEHDCGLLFDEKRKLAAKLAEHGIEAS